MTYSLVARDPDTGEFGVAVQSHWFSVGSVVPHVREGVGDGASPDEALEAVLDGDAGVTMRQLAVVDASGRVAVHTGEACITAAGHVIGDGFSCQANMMARDTVWDAMASAFASSSGPLAERLVGAVEA